ncbi:hypothetical protein GCM10010357_41360 [Streptomyces luteireticuli]|uniref:Exo-alpha-sialidase n=1 Tax=Streptomyces luteireticuli TaxID=173858 RepID=A0ABN0YX41_9ACTN
MLACTGIALAPGAASAAPAAAAPATADCLTDTGAKGLASSPVADSLISVGRADGRTAQFQLFYDRTATRGLPFVWHREQDEPGGAYGPWERVGAATVGPKSYAITAVENSTGDLELLFSTYGSFCRTVENDSGDGWSAPDDFGLAPMPYHGGVVLFKERNGSIDAFADGSRSGSAMQVRHQEDADAGWGPVGSMGQVPEPGVNLGQPTAVEQLPDGRLHVVAQEWNRVRMWEVYQSEPGGGWGPWQRQSTGPASIGPKAAATAGSAGR